MPLLLVVVFSVRLRARSCINVLVSRAYMDLNVNHILSSFAVNNNDNNNNNNNNNNR